MRAVPIPKSVPGQRVVIGEADPCEYLLGESEIYPGRHTFTALVELEGRERDAISAGAQIWLTLDAVEVPWSLRVAGPDA